MAPGLSGAISLPSVQLSPAVLAACVSIVAISLYLLYSWLLPKPLQGIPFNQAAAKSLLGDIPELVAYISKTQQIWPWVTDQCMRHQSPIAQVFAQPFGKPWVVLTDPRESHDLLMRRKDFDRSLGLGNLFKGVAPDFHILRESSDPQFKRHRLLLKDLMTPGFLHEVSAPNIYANVESTIELWQLKKKLARGRPFDAREDVFNTALDTIFAVTFGLDPKDGATMSNLDLLRANNFSLATSDGTGSDQPVHLPEAPRPTTLDAIVTLTDSIEVAAQSVVPRLAHWLHSQKPFMRRARAVKENLIKVEVDASIQRMESGSQVKRSALDDILHREKDLAEKEGREPAYHCRSIYDETFGFLLGGHDTTSNTLLWGLKSLSDTPAAQTTLRTALRTAYHEATSEKRAPTVAEITKIPIPYLDATIEEICRTAVTSHGVFRRAMVDTTLLGYHIPKGTDVCVLQDGPGYFGPALPVSDSQRSESSLASKQKYPEWDIYPDDLSIFRPERWLVKNEQGEDECNSQARPYLTFGGGTRGCYGRRLAFLEMRIIIVMILWHFTLLPLSENVKGWKPIDKLMRTPDKSYIILGDVE